MSSIATFTISGRTFEIQSYEFDPESNGVHAAIIETFPNAASAEWTEDEIVYSTNAMAIAASVRMIVETVEDDTDPL